tara:strand:+ start:7991 stop:8734 length:744 start_codon:yes stop_codon:yes gene_type:complete
LKNILNFLDKYSAKSDTYTFKFFGRPLAYFLSEFMSKYVTANQVTYFRAVLVIISLSFIAIDHNIYFNIGVLLFFLNIVFDAVDGQIARKKNNASYWGKFLDGYIDSVSYALLPFVCAINLLLKDTSSLDIILCLLLFYSSLLYLLECFFRERLVFYREWIIKENINLKEKLFFNSRINIYLANTFYDLVHLLLLGVLILVPLKVFYSCIVIIYIYTVTIRLIALVIVASNNLRVHRKSKFKPAKDI